MMVVGGPCLQASTERATRGRALYVGPRGELYIANRYAVYRSTDGGTAWVPDCYIPDFGWKWFATRTRLGARLLRHYIAAFQVLVDGSRIAVARDGVYRAAAGEMRMHRGFRLTRGARPLNIAVDGNRVLFGEYGELAQDAACIYCSDDGGRTFDVFYRFRRGDIRHIHNIVVDSTRDGYWVFVGDFGPDPGIGFLSKDGKHLEWLGRGSQRLRVVSALIEPDCLICGTDSDHDRNFIVRIDKQSGRVDDLREVEGSSLYATRFGDVRLISTCVEPNPACSSRECSLYASRDGEEWKRTIVREKDRYHPKYFQFGTLVLPYSCSLEPRGMFSGQAVKGLDDRVTLIDFD